MLIWAVLLGAAVGGGTAVDDVLELVYARVAARDSTIADAVYHGAYRYWEEDDAGRMLRVETCERIVYVSHGREHVDYLSVAVNGRELGGRAREKQLAALAKKGLVVTRTDMPFDRETADAYGYKLIGGDSCDGRDVWVVDFDPRRKSQETIVGRAFIDRQTGDILRMEFRPTRLPWVCGETKMSIQSAEIDGFWFPVLFEMEMRLRIRVIVTLMSRTLRVADRFTDYRFNTGLPESVFDREE